MMPSLYKTFPQYSEFSRDYWRVKLVFHALILSGVVFALLAIENIVFSGLTSLIWLDTLGGVGSMLLYVWFRRSGNINICACLVTLHITFLISFYLYIKQGSSLSIMWVTVIPPIAFFLMGSVCGALVTLFAFSVAIYFVYLQIHGAINAPLTFTALSNVVEVLFLHLLIFKFYERTRKAGYTQIEQQHQKLVMLARTDGLTGLLKRETFEEQFIHTMACYPSVPNVLVVMDIDRFKQINDTQGHAGGDKVLQTFAALLLKNMRKTDILARWGGEEFIALLPNTSLQDANELVNRWREYFESEKVQQLTVSMSAGIALCNQGEALKPIFERADKALYAAKRNGRNCVVVSHSAPALASIGQ
jgi:diguanylate cyclase (GGDEF)-like protein